MELTEIQDPGSDGTSASLSSSGRVVAGIMAALEQRRMVPGQRLIETELALQFGVGRNAVREAVAQLAARGIVDLARNRSPSIRSLGLDEVLEILAVAEAMNGLLAGLAARNFDSSVHSRAMRSAREGLKACSDGQELPHFNDVRRRFYRVLLDIARNRELRRIFSTIHMEIIQAQYQSPQLHKIRLEDYAAISNFVAAGNVRAATSAGKRHVRRVRTLILGRGGHG